MLLVSLGRYYYHGNIYNLSSFKKSSLIRIFLIYFLIFYYYRIFCINFVYFVELCIFLTFGSTNKSQQLYNYFHLTVIVLSNKTPKLCISSISSPYSLITAIHYSYFLPYTSTLT